MTHTVRSPTHGYKPQDTALPNDPQSWVQGHTVGAPRTLQLSLMATSKRPRLLHGRHTPRSAFLIEQHRTREFSDFVILKFNREGRGPPLRSQHSNRIHILRKILRKTKLPSKSPGCHMGEGVNPPM